jgi:transposase-like protein
VRRFSEAEKQTIWDMRDAGVPVMRIARHVGRQPVSLRKFLSGNGGNVPVLGRSEAIDDRTGHSNLAVGVTCPVRCRD